tara:strand:- start:295 stop:1260 length:966 start_codon:yes stop_codon:yes gene_type:complete
MMKISTIRNLLLILAINVMFFASSQLHAQEVSRSDTALNGAISTFVQNVLTDDTAEFNQFVKAMMVAMTFIGIAWYVIGWALKKYDVGTLVVYLISCFVIWAFYANYNEALSDLWGWSDSIGLGIQEQATGTDDKLFVVNKLMETIGRFFLDDISILDGLLAITGMLFFTVITLILKVVVFIASQWSIWGYAFCKIIGLVFLPLVLWPVTRSVFTNWFQMFLGFWFFNLFIKVGLTLYYIYFNAIFGVVDGPVSFNPVADHIAIMRINLHMLVGIMFLISLGALSGMMAQGFGGAVSATSRSMSNTSKDAAKVITQFIAKI